VSARRARAKRFAVKPIWRASPLAGTKEQSVLSHRSESEYEKEMTLIACLSIDTHPVFLADALLSSPTGRLEVSLPSTGIRHSLVKSSKKLKVWGYDQKIVRIGPGVIAAWAGERALAYKILSGVKLFFENTRPTAFYLRAYIVANHPEEIKRVSLIFTIMEEGGNLETVWYSCRELIVPPIGQVIFAGSGASRFARYLNQPSMPVLHAGNALRVGLSEALMLTGSLLADEMATGVPLEDAFGGGYEIASFWDGSSQKLTDCIYIFWFPEQQMDGGFSFHLHPRKLIRRYENFNRTAFYCLEIEPKVGFSGDAKEEIFIVKDFLSDTAKVEVCREPPDLNTKWQVNIFCAKLLNGRHRIGTQTNYRHDAKRHTVMFTERDDRGLEIEIDHEAVRQTLIGFLKSG
jgi:hypothetical protein